jgi:hypothetical protein
MTKMSWRDANASDLKIKYEDGAVDDNGILQPGRRAHVGIMMRGCRQILGSGKIQALSIKCPVCGGSGLVNSNGQGIDPGEVARATAATSTHTESARNGEFGTDRANDSRLSETDRMVLADAEYRARVGSPHRAGYRMADSQMREWADKWARPRRHVAAQPI